MKIPTELIDTFGNPTTKFVIKTYCKHCQFPLESTVRQKRNFDDVSAFYVYAFEIQTESCPRCYTESETRLRDKLLQ